MLVTTKYGEVDDSLLEKREYHDENDHEARDTVEYWLGEELVHRSVHVHLKETPFAGGLPGQFL